MGSTAPAGPPCAAMIPLFASHAVGLSSRLPVVLQPRRHRRGRPAHVGHRQRRAPVHAWRDLRQGARVRRARPFAAARLDAAASRRPEGGGRFRADLVGRGDRHDRRAVARHHRQRGRRDDPAVLLRGLDGPGPVLRGPSVVPRPGRQSARALDLHVDRVRGLAGMHVLVAEDLIDRDYIARATLGFERLTEHLKRYAPAAVAPIVGLDADAIVRLARRYGRTRRTFIRIGIGISRHDNGAMTCRTLACLPALTGAYADAHGGALLSTGGAYGFDYSVLERPDLMPTPAPRTVNMIQLGRALTDRAMSPPVRALYVYSSNPAAVCPNQTLVLGGLAREDLFTVVHEQVMTDTAHYADLVLPATTSMEHADLYRSFGQFYFQYAELVIAPQGEARSNWEVFP